MLDHAAALLHDHLTWIFSSGTALLLCAMWQQQSLMAHFTLSVSRSSCIQDGKAMT